MQRRVGSPGRQPGPERLVADMVVVLQKRYESRSRQRCRALAARSTAAKPRGFTLIGKALGQGATEMRRRSYRIIPVEAEILAGDQDMQGVVQVIVPLRGVRHGPPPVACQIAGLVAIIFEDEMDLPVSDAAAHDLGEFSEDIGV